MALGSPIFFALYCSKVSACTFFFQHKYFFGYPQTCNLLIPRVWIFNILIDTDKFLQKMFFSGLYPQPEPRKPVGLAFLSVSWVYVGRLAANVILKWYSGCTKNPFPGILIWNMCSPLTLTRALMGLPWRLSGKEPTCQRRGHRCDLWSRKIPHAAEQLSPFATTTEPVL